MSFQPPRLGTFVRIPPAVRMGMRARRMMPTKLAPTGLLALLVAGLAGVAYFKETGYATADKIMILGAVILAVIGGALSLVKQEVGASIAAGAVTVFVATAALLIGGRIDSSNALDPLAAKLYLGAGVAGLILVFIVVADLFGRVNTPVGAAIAILAIASPVCFAAIVHIDDSHGASLVAAVAGQVLVAAVIAVGALKGAFGAAASLVAAGLLLPHWVTRIQDFDDRKPAALAAAASLVVIVVLAVVLLVMSRMQDVNLRAAEAAENDPALITADWQPATGAVAPTPVAVIVPGYLAPPTVAQPRVGVVVQPVAAPMTPAAVQTNGQWDTDPYGRYQVRYWNGKKWTHHVATNGITGIDPIE